MTRPVPVTTPPSRRWSLRRVELTVGTFALVTAVWLGLTAPSVSPVTPAAAPPAAVATGAVPAAP